MTQLIIGFVAGAFFMIFAFRWFASDYRVKCDCCGELVKVSRGEVQQ